MYEVDSKSFGLIIVQPEGINIGLDTITQEILVNPNPAENPIFDYIFSRYSAEDRMRIIRDLSAVTVPLTLERYVPKGSTLDKIWDLNYGQSTDRNYYNTLRESLYGPLKAFVLESPLSDDEMDWFLKSLKGDKRILNADGTEFIRPGKPPAHGLRSLATNKMHDLSNFETLPTEVQKEVVVRFLHTSDDLTTVLESLFILLQPLLHIDDIAQVKCHPMSEKNKIQRLITIYRKKYDLLT